MALHAAVGLTRADAPPSELARFDLVVEVTNSTWHPMRGVQVISMVLTGPDGATTATGHRLVVERYDAGPTLPRDWTPFTGGTPFTGELPSGPSILRVHGGLDRPPAPVQPMRYVLTIEREGGLQTRISGEIMPAPS